MARKNSEPNIPDALLDLFKSTPWWVGPPVILLAWLLFRFLLPSMITATAADDSNLAHDLAVPMLVMTAPYIAALVLLLWFISLANKAISGNRLESQTNLDSIRSLTWHDFELLLAKAFRRQGYAVRESPPGPDGGIDLTLTRNNETTIVQAKNWRNDRKVGVRVVRELCGVMHAFKAQRAILVTSGTLTQDARAFAAKSGVQIIEGDALARMIAEVQRSGSMQPQPEPTVASGVPMCPACQIPMILKTARRGPSAGQQFWGCSGFPDCRFTRDTGQATS